MPPDGDRRRRGRAPRLAAAALAVALGAAARAEGAPADAAALRAALEAPAPRPAALPPLHDALRRAYAAGELLWVRDGAPTPQALAVAELLRDAARKGLDPADYAGPGWPERVAALAAATAEARARADVALSACALRYLEDLHGGRVDPRALGADVPPPVPDGGEVARLRAVAAAADVAAAVAAVEPQYAAYRRTARALEAHLALAAAERPFAVRAPRRPPAPGEPYAEAPLLGARLALLGDLAPADAAAGAGGTFDAALEAALRRFQRRHGLEPDGRLGRRTAAALAVPLAARAGQLALALERWRSLPGRLEPPALVVNIPEFRLYALGPGGVAMNVAVGQAFRWRTPVLAARLREVVFRPAWNVPRSIVVEELAPRLAREPGHLATGGYELVGRDGVARPAEAVGPEDLAALRAGALRLRQRPGPANALGGVKFVFPNAHGVYLHGTPARALFRRARRDVTHGCIRVEDPAALAAFVLQGAPGWTPERIAAAMSGPATQAVRVATPIPVLVLYGTAVAGADGAVRFTEDLYGHDAALARALAARR